MDLEAKTIIANHYEVVRKLGAGGMGDVYLVEDLSLDRKRRALKLLHSHTAKDERQVARFKQEMLLASELSHENIIKLYEFGETDKGDYFITMEYVEGRSLKDKLRSEGKLAFPEVLRILYYLAGALNQAHSKNIIHRDLKPDNILLTEAGDIKLSDFGIARSLLTDKGLTATGEMVGTAYYMSPEQFVGKSVDRRTDVYAFGILAYELATGKRPFDEPSFIVMSTLHLTQPIPRFATKGSGIEPWFQDFVERCCAKRPEDRFQSIADAAEVLHTHMQAMGLEVSSVDVLLSSSQGKRLAKRTLNTTVLKRFALAILIGVMHMLFLSRHPTIPWAGWVGEAINLKTMDVWFQLRGRIPPPEDVVIIAIDEKSHEELGASTVEAWPRKLTAELLEKLATQHPRAIVLDFLYSERLDPEIDARFANSLSLSPTYLSKVLKENQTTSLSGEQSNSLEWLLPDEFFAKRAAGLFFAKVWLDRSGVVRYFKYRDLYFFGNPPEEVLFKDISPPPKLPGPEEFINFYGPPGSLRSVPFYKIIRGEIPPDSLKGKYLLVGRQLTLAYTSAPSDTFLTPLGKATAGVEIIGTTLGNILSQNWIRRLPIATEAYFSLIFATLIAYGFVSNNLLRAIYQLLIMSVVLIFLEIICLHYGHFIPTLPFLVTAATAFALGLLPMVRHLLPYERILKS